MCQVSLFTKKLCRLQLKCDGTWWRMVGKVKGKLANWVGSQYPSHYLGTWCIQHYYRWCAHLGCQQSTELKPHGRYKWTRPFRLKTKSGFCACAITFQTQSTSKVICIKNNIFCFILYSDQPVHTIISHITTLLLHVSTLLCHPQGVRS